ELLYNILINVEPSVLLIEEIPLVCRRFRNTVQSIPISIRCGLLVLGNEDKVNYEVTVDSFKKIDGNAGMIPPDPRGLVSLLQDYVKLQLFGDSDRMTKATVNFVHVLLQGTPNVSHTPKFAKRICDFAKLVEPQSLGLLPNTPEFAETEKLPITQLDLYQNFEASEKNFTSLGKHSSTLQVLSIRHASRNRMIPDGCLFNVSRNVMEFDFTRLRKLQKLLIEDPMSATAFFKLARTVSSPAILEVGVGVDESPDFLIQLHRLNQHQPDYQFFTVGYTANFSRVSKECPDYNSRNAEPRKPSDDSTTSRYHGSDKICKQDIEPSFVGVVDKRSPP
ncbi:hypothetical protein HDU76_010180, partial [Blyttiomyces sp. JEL0837]